MLGRMTELKRQRRDGERVVVLRGTSPDAEGAILERRTSGKPLNNLELIEHLCAVSEALREERKQQVLGLASLTPHVFMAAVLARVEACLTADTTWTRSRLRPELDAILRVLEVAAGAADPATRKVIAASFLREGERQRFFAELHPLLGHQLAQLSTVRTPRFSGASPPAPGAPGSPSEDR